MTLAMQTIEDSIRNAMLAAGSNTNVIFHYPNAPRPEFPYTSIQYLNTSAYIDDNEQFDLSDDLVKTFGVREMFFTINCFGANARDEANQLQARLNLLVNRDILSQLAGITIWRMEPVIDLTALVDSDFEIRTVFDIVFNVPLVDGEAEDYGYFDSVAYISSQF